MLLRARGASYERGGEAWCCARDDWSTSDNRSVHGGSRIGERGRGKSIETCLC